MSESKPVDADQLRDEIEHTRADLADTVDALSAKLDVKAQARAKVRSVKATVTDTAARANRPQVLAATGAAAAGVAGVVLIRRRARRSH